MKLCRYLPNAVPRVTRSIMRKPLSAMTHRQLVSKAVEWLRQEYEFLT